MCPLVLIACVVLVLLPQADAQISRLDKRYNVQRNESPAPSTGVKRRAPETKLNSPVAQYVSYSELYNDESVSLPAWFVEEVGGINEQLKAQLSPSDYLEILKGERYLYGDFGTRDEYVLGITNKDKYNFNELRELSALKRKLLEILKHPNNPGVFARPHFLPRLNKGVFFNEYIRFTSDWAAFGDEEFILTFTSGKSRGCSSIWSFWDARTGRIREQFYSPTDVYENYIYARKSPLGTIYALSSAMVELSGLNWDGKMYANYLVVPQIRAYESLCGNGGTILRVSENGAAVAQALIDNPSQPILPAPWYHDTKSLDGFYISLDQENSTDTHEDAGRFSIYEQKKGGFDLVWNSLSMVKRNKEVRNESEKYIESQIWGVLQPTPKSEKGNPISEKYKGFAEDRVFESCIIVGDTSSQEILYSVYNNEGMVETHGVLGLYTPHGNFLFPSKYRDSRYWGSELPLEGKLVEYKDAIDSGRKLGKYEFVSQNSLWRKLKVHRTASEDERLLEIVCRVEQDRVDFREDARLIKLNLKDMSFKTLYRDVHFGSRLVFCWIPEKELILKPESDNQYSIVELKEGRVGRKMADFYVDTAQGYAIVLPDGRYAGSPGCESFLAYGDGERVVGLQTLAPWRNRPAEVLESIGGNSDDIAALRETTKRWLVKQGFEPEHMPAEPKLDEFPKAEVDMPPLFSPADTARFCVKLRSTSRAIHRLEVFADGVRIPQGWDDALSIAAGEEKEVTVEVPLISGQNWIEVIPVDDAGISGESTRFRTIYRGKARSDLFIVAIGVSDYNDPNFKLQYAAKDARDIAAAFEKHGVGRKRILVLTDKEVQDRNVLEKVREFLSSALPDDRVVLYVAGHGMLDDRLNYYYAPAGFEAERIAETGIPMDELKACLHEAKARRRLLLLDTCHSGVLGEEGEDKLAASGVQLPHGVRAIQHRGMNVKKVATSFNTKQKKRYIEDMFSLGSTERGLNIIAGAAGAEYALESSSWNNGVFTAAIMQALLDVKTDRNGDEMISIAELQQAVSERVAELTGGAQRPSSVASEGSEEFIVKQFSASNREASADPASSSMQVAEVSLVTPISENLSLREAELNHIIDDLRQTIYQSSVEKLYQRRLLQLLEMIQNGASVNTVLPNANGTTALHNACGLSREDVVQWLLANGADINARTAKGASVETCVGGSNAGTISKLLREARKKKQ